MPLLSTILELESALALCPLNPVMWTSVANTVPNKQRKRRKKRESSSVADYSPYSYWVEYFVYIMRVDWLSGVRHIA